MTKAGPMQGGYHTRRCKQLQQYFQLTDRSTFRFNAPRHWADEQDQWCTKRNVHFLIVADEASCAGLQHYVKQDKLNKGFACASQLGNPQNPPQRPTELKMTIQQTVSPPGLYPPKYYPKATNTTTAAWSPEEQPTSEEFSKIFHKTELKFRPDEIIHTDGGRKAIPHIGTCLVQCVQIKGAGQHANKKRWQQDLLPQSIWHKASMPCTVIGCPRLTSFVLA
ncbi:TPA: hypothetical protein ACH3X1_003534 [Trebouxia sp. C0004]